MRRYAGLDGGGEGDQRDGDGRRDQRRGQQLVPGAAAAGGRPGGERDEYREQLGQRGREDREQQRVRGDVEPLREVGGAVAERVGLRQQREQRRGGDEDDRQ